MSVCLWIDAASCQPQLSVFGMSLPERHARAARKMGVMLAEIVLDAPPPGFSLPHGAASVPVIVRAGAAPLGARLAAALGALPAGRALIAVAGDEALDQRLFGELSGREGDWIAREGACAILKLTPGLAGRIPAAATHLAAVAEALLASGAARELHQQEFTAHIAALRRDLPFWLRKVEDEQARAKLERFMFKASYKGSTDFFTKYVYPPLVWLAVRPLARARVHPNTVTWLSVALTLLAVPLFAAGWWVAGLACAYGMSVLDSVDGKLARLTYSDSKFGNLLDHGLDIVHPPLWYLAWAAGLAGLPLSQTSLQAALAVPLMQAAMAMVAFYVLDRLVLMVYRLKFARGLHAHAPIDGLVRTFISRRNINLPLFTLGLIFGVAVEAFTLIVAWQVATFAYHGGRVAWILARRQRPAAPSHDK